MDKILFFFIIRQAQQLRSSKYHKYTKLFNYYYRSKKFRHFSHRFVYLFDESRDNLDFLFQLMNFHRSPVISIFFGHTDAGAIILAKIRVMIAKR